MPRCRKSSSTSPRRWRPPSASAEDTTTPDPPDSSDPAPLTTATRAHDIAAGRRPRHARRRTPHAQPAREVSPLGIGQQCLATMVERVLDLFAMRPVGPGAALAWDPQDPECLLVWVKHETAPRRVVCSPELLSACSEPVQSAAWPQAACWLIYELTKPPRVAPEA
jgi:hypothetical protein